MHNKTSNHYWKTYEVSTTAPDGTLLKGKVIYWAKDYTTCMYEPFEAESSGHHLQLAVPAVYATDETPRKGVHFIDLIERGKEELLALYSSEVKYCNTKKENIC